MIDDDRIVPTVDEDGNLVGGIKKEDMDRIVVSIDPAGTSSKKRDETGITVIGRKGDHYYVLADYSDHYTPDGWAKKAWYAYDLWEADLIVAEKNYGGEMVLSTLRNVREDGKVDLVTSRRGKELRAEPVVGLYEQHRVHHTANFGELEQQMCEWVPGASDSPDRVDALVHGVVKLSEGGGATSVSVPSGNIGRPPIGSAGRIGQLRFSDIADSAVLRGGHSAA
jgi:phage terminase large subunit-like protein